MLEKLDALLRKSLGLHRPGAGEHDAHPGLAVPATWADGWSAALQTTSLIRDHARRPAAATEYAALEALLEVADSIMTYRSRYLARVQLGPVLDLLLTDESNPRSVAFQLVNCAAHVEQLPREADEIEDSPETRARRSRCWSMVRSVDSQTLARDYHPGDAEQLDWLFTKLESTLPKLVGRGLAPLLVPRRSDAAAGGNWRGRHLAQRAAELVRLGSTEPAPMRYNIRHTTVYSYTDPVPVCHNLVHLAPRDTPAQICREHRLAIDPQPSVRRQAARLLRQRRGVLLDQRPTTG